jgi:hydroxymethylglutaryl-CoA lyase
VPSQQHPPTLELIEVAPRDGLQNEADVLGTADKLALIERLIAAGMRRIEVASFVRADRVPQMADADALCAQLPVHERVRYSGLVLNERGFERAVRSERLHEIICVVCSTDTFGQRNQGQTVLDGLRFAAWVCEHAPRYGLTASVTIATAFGCPLEGEVAASRIAELAERIVPHSPAELVLADTIGVAVPAAVRGVLAAVRDKVPVSVPLRMHFHNTRNTAVANVDAAIALGVRAFDASVGGIGGCPFAPAAAGNVASEDLAYLFNRSGYACHAQLDGLIDTARWLGEKLGRQLPGMVSKAGAFPRAHSG